MINDSHAPTKTGSTKAKGTQRHAQLLAVHDSHDVSIPTGWWFGTLFFCFPYIGIIGNLIIPIDSYFSEGFETTNQPTIALKLKKYSSIVVLFFSWHFLILGTEL